MVSSAQAKVREVTSTVGANPAAAEDQRLVSAAQAGSAEAFSALVDKYQTKVYGIVYRMCGPQDVEDLTQDIFLRALAALRKFQFQGEASFRTWLYRIAVNTCINDLRRRKRRQQIEGPSLDEMVSTEGGMMERAIPDHSRIPHDVAERRELQRQVQETIQTLPPHHRVVITLIDLENVDYEEAARIIGCPLGTLKSRLARARQAFGKKFRRLDGTLGQ
jgi:RNA polymerase sigma-70 factor, ECF subfamily